MGLATGLTLSDVSVAGLLGIRESSSYSFGKGMGVCCGQRGRKMTGGEKRRGSEITVTEKIKKKEEKWE